MSSSAAARVHGDGEGLIHRFCVYYKYKYVMFIACAMQCKLVYLFMQRKNNDCEKWIWKINKISLLVRMAFKIWMHRAWNKQEQSYISAISIWYKDTVIQRTNIKMILQFNICWIIIFISWLRQQIRCKRYIAIAGGSCKFNTREAGPVSRIATQK